jgi:hypothetical protein
MGTFMVRENIPSSFPVFKCNLFMTILCLDLWLPVWMLLLKHSEEYLISSWIEHYCLGSVNWALLYSCNSMATYHCIRQGCKNLWHQVATATKSCIMAPNICEYSLWNLRHVTCLVPRILRWPLVFGKFVHTSYKASHAHSWQLVFCISSSYNLYWAFKPILADANMHTVNWAVCDFTLPQWCKWDLCPFGMLHTADWYLVTDVSGQPIGPFFKVKQSKKTLEDGTNSLSRNNGN